VFRPILSRRPPRPDLASLADEDLMARVQGGDARAFEVIFDRHADAAFSLAYRMCGRRVTAEDVVQEAFLSLWRSGARYDRTRGSVRSWVLGVIHNRAIDLFRRDSVRTSRDVSDEGAAERMAATGFALPVPAMSGAEPCTGSNIDGPVRSGLRLADAAMPMPPVTAPPRSVRMSPKRLSVTMVS